MRRVKNIISRLRWSLSMRWGIGSDANLIANAVYRRKIIDAPVMINLGCGTRTHPAWINIDFRGDGDKVYSWDLRKHICLPDQCCDVIYASHLIEHFSRDAARHMLCECRRLLRPSGIIRLVAPDLEALTKCYLKTLNAVRHDEPGAAARYDWIVIELLDQLVRHESGGEMLKYWAQEKVPEEDFVAERVGAEYRNAREFGLRQRFNSNINTNPVDVGRFRLGGEVHRWMYDSYSLARLMEECGFQNPLPRTAFESGIDCFDSYCLDASEDGVIHKPDSFFIEAVAI